MQIRQWLQGDEGHINHAAGSGQTEPILLRSVATTHLPTLENGIIGYPLGNGLKNKTLSYLFPILLLQLFFANLEISISKPTY